jgi:primosomal protein N' (replication factor Y)
MRIVVPCGKRELVGIIWEVVTNSSLDITKLKAAIAILDHEVLLPDNMLALIKWTSDYYHHPLGEVVTNVLPQLLRQKKNKQHQHKINSNSIVLNSKTTESKLNLNQDQAVAVATISKELNKFKTFLLAGVTGSGKTEVYLQVIATVIASGKQALVLVPEINLTPQTIARFTARFPVTIAVFHSRLTPRERLQSWQLARLGEAPIIIGTRSAIFTPLKNIGIIIVDEEHDSSFKQQSGLRYSARDLAIVRGKLDNIPVVLGSATPAIETIYNVKRHRYIGLSLPERAGNATQPNFYLVDMRNQKLKNGIAETLLQKIEAHLNAGNQVLVFINRRGFAPILICHHCGFVANCKYCDAYLTLHHKKKHLRCHHCGVVTSIPSKCPQCTQEKLLMLGAGTERIEMALQELFPQTKIVRLDRDTTKRKNSLEDILKKITTNNCQILVGTQMVAKGHHFPQVTMAAILNVDQTLCSTDFRASEQLAQLIIQVAGRVGRATTTSEVYLQTHNPHHPLLLDLMNGGYISFVNNCLAERHAAELPPYSYLALLQAESKKEQAALDFLTAVNSKIKNKISTKIKVFGPVTATMERKAGYFRAQLLLQSDTREKLQQGLDILLDVIATLKKISTVRWFLDVDPIELNG